MRFEVEYTTERNNCGKFEGRGRRVVTAYTAESAKNIAFDVLNKSIKEQRSGDVTSVHILSARKI